MSRTMKRLLVALLTLVTGAAFSGCAYGSPTTSPDLMLRGKVTQSNGQPIAGVQITVQGQDQTASLSGGPITTTDTTGNYTFEEWAPSTSAGKITVTATASSGNFAGASQTVSVPAITAGTPYSTEVDFTLQSRQ